MPSFNEYIACIDTPSGISGDMFLGCLIDAGWSLEALRETLGKLPIRQTAWDVEEKRVVKQGIRATQILVRTVDTSENRTLTDICKLITASTLNTIVKERSIAVFDRLARAEAKVHGVDIQSVHFHEVGALDAIIDIVGVVAGLHDLNIGQIYSTGIPLGQGWAQAAHGMIPVPAPATLELLTEVNATIRKTMGAGELTTPTGAALLAEFAEFSEIPLQLERSGIGAGTKDFDWPNIARMWMGKISQDHEQLVEISTNIDDMQPELFEPVMHSLFAAGALDVWFTPIQMKKNRPGVILSCLAPTDYEDKVTDIILLETSTLGVRSYQLRRVIANRKMDKVNIVYGTIPVKLKLLKGRIVGAKPEYESCRELAMHAQVTTHEVYALASAEAFRKFVSFGGERK